MPLASALELVLNEYGIYDVDTFVAVLRRTPEWLAGFLERDDIRARLAVAAANAPSTPAVNVVLQVAAPPPPPITVNAALHIDVQTAMQTATVGTETDRHPMHNEVRYLALPYAQYTGTDGSQLGSGHHDGSADSLDSAQHEGWQHDDGRQCFLGQCEHRHVLGQSQWLVRHLNTDRGTRRDSV